VRALQGRVLAEKIMGPVLFDKLPSAFGTPQEAWAALHRSKNGTGESRNAIKITWQTAWHSGLLGSDEVEVERPRPSPQAQRAAGTGTSWLTKQKMEQLSPPLLAGRTRPGGQFFCVGAVRGDFAYRPL
jgi:hypothetical protein